MRALLLLPLALSANPADGDGDGWADSEEIAKGFRPDNPFSHPPAPRYAPVDLGSVAERGWPVALADEGHRVLTERGFRWSWAARWERLAVPRNLDRVDFAAIRSDGAVLGRADSSVDGIPASAIWKWGADGVPTPIPRTLHRFVPDDSPAPWVMRPLRWLRGEGFLLAAEPIVLEPGPVGVDILIGDATAGVPAPSRRHLSPHCVSSSVGERWVASFDSPDGTWRLDGSGRALGPDAEPLAWSEEGALLVRREGALRLEEVGAASWNPPFSASVSRAALADGPGALRAIVALDSPEPLVWDIDAPDRDLRAPELLAHLVDSSEGWTELHPVAMDRAGAVLAVGRRAGSAPRIVLLVPFRVRADLVRKTDDDGLRSDFPMEEEGFPREHRPLRLWLNDDRDEGALAPDSLSDLPGQSSDGRVNLRQEQVGGASDLVDWIPVALRLGASAENLPPYEVRLLGPAHLLAAVETSMPVIRAAQFLQRDLGASHGPGLDQPLGNATKARAALGGIGLSPAFARSTVGPRLLGRGEGVFLLEGVQSGQGVIWVALVRPGIQADRQPAAEDMLLRAPLRVSVKPVKDFFRSWDARDRSASLVPSPAQSPPTEAPGPWVVFVHGFNVPSDPGKAWGAEIFKRLHQAGSIGRFIAFRWYGDQGAANYASAVECAPAAAERLRIQLEMLDKAEPGRPFVLIGHSLGCYVALLAAESALSRKSVEVGACVLINAAVPSEALDPMASGRAVDYPEGAGLAAARLMTPPGSAWRTTAPFAEAEFQSPRWAFHFPAADGRSSCRWTGRFSLPCRLVNLYSRSEDVLSPPPADDSRWPGVLAVADHGAWIYQEATKGRWPGKWLNHSRAQAGWGLSSKAAQRAHDLILASPDRREQLLRTRPLFDEPREDALLHPDVGADSRGSRASRRRLSSLRGLGASALPSGAGWTVRDELLAHAVPALSPAAGSVPLASLVNYRMDGAGEHDPSPGALRPFPLGWPSGVEAVAYLGSPAPVWRHSDIKNVAFPYVHPAFAAVIREASLSLPVPARP